MPSSGNRGFASFCEIGKIFSYHRSSNYLLFNSFNIPFNSTTLFFFLSFPLFFFRERVWSLLIGEKRKKEKCYFLFAHFLCVQFSYILYFKLKLYINNVHRLYKIEKYHKHKKKKKKKQSFIIRTH